jgi:SAM-dependent methyltransferase
VLQVGAHKGFLLEALHQRHIRVAGTEFSEYPARQSKCRLYRAPFTKLPFEDESFDLVIGVSCVYTLNLPDAIKCLREIQRVSRGQSFITLAAYENEEDIEGLMLLRYWFLLGTTILTKPDWLAVMAHAGYTGTTASTRPSLPEPGARVNRPPPIEMVPCGKCGAPSAFQFVGGSFCHKHWGAAYREFHEGKAA